MSPDLVIEPLAGYEPLIASAVWALQDTRSRTLEALDGLSDDHLDIVSEGHENSIGTVLYHLAAIELDWLYVEILEAEFPDWAYSLFPSDVRTDQGRLTPVHEEALAEHLGRLARVRIDLLEQMKTLTDDDFTRSRLVDGRTVSAQWVVHHLNQHEAEHRGEIQTLRSLIATRADTS